MTITQRSIYYYYYIYYNYYEYDDYYYHHTMREPSPAAPSARTNTTHPSTSHPHDFST